MDAFHQSKNILTENKSSQMHLGKILHLANIILNSENMIIIIIIMSNNKTIQFYYSKKAFSKYLLSTPVHK